jgi:hypothetical protein
MLTPKYSTDTVPIPHHIDLGRSFRGCLISPKTFDQSQLYPKSVERSVVTHIAGLVDPEIGKDCLVSSISRSNSKEHYLPTER